MKLCICKYYDTKEVRNHVHISNYDKPHRCPVCWGIADKIRKRNYSARRFSVYTCTKGHRYSKSAILRFIYGLKSSSNSR